ncbi:hypothetical protein B4144_0400 [Bacillus atrophaeus]|nr:hypothetical protein B4144_0400 [Bacillus atrophaeus]
MTAPEILISLPQKSERVTHKTTGYFTFWILIFRQVNT